MKKYTADGYVMGNLWGGGKGSYPARHIEADTKTELLDKANEMLNDGSLDSGMGYESLTGALLTICEIEIAVIGDKEFSHVDNHIEFIGKVNEVEQEFLLKSLV